RRLRPRGRRGAFPILDNRGQTAVGSPNGVRLCRISIGVGVRVAVRLKEVEPMEEHSSFQRAVAEIIGTGLLVFVGAGSVPAILLLEGGTKAPFSGADLGFISIAFGLIVVAMIYTIGKVSGCHINPAVTFALAATKRFPWREVPIYWGAQVLG